MDKNSYLIIILIFIILGAGIFSYMMMSSYWYDENMYISASVLAQDHEIYQDFAYLQMPYFPLVFGFFFKIIGTSYYFLLTELLNFIFMISATILIFLIAYRVSNNLFVSLTTLIIFVFNDITIYILRYSANTIMPLPFALLGFYLFYVSVDQKNIKSIGVLMSGLSIAIAIGTKLYYAAMLPPFFLICFVQPRSLNLKERMIKILLPFMVGVLVGLLPVLYYAFRNFDVFIFNNFDYHQINTSFRSLEGSSHTMSLKTKLFYGRRITRSPANMILFITFLILLFTHLRDRTQTKGRFRQFIQMESLLPALLVIFTIVAALTPTPLWDHYFALPVPFILILINYWHKILNKAGRHFMHTLFGICILVSIIFNGEKFFGYLHQIHNINKWTSIALHHEAIKIKNYIGTTENNQKVATLFPLYAIESRLSFYKEFSTGSFVYRLSGLIPENKLTACKCVSPNNFRDLFDQDPPKAILLKFDQNKIFYEPFEKYAQECNYEKIETDLEEIILYVRQDK